MTTVKLNSGGRSGVVMISDPPPPLLRAPNHFCCCCQGATFSALLGQINRILSVASFLS